MIRDRMARCVGLEARAGGGIESNASRKSGDRWVRRTMIIQRDFHGILFDLDGVLYVDVQPVPGAAEVVRAVRERGIACRFLTNTSTLALESLHQKLRGLGLPVDEHEILSAPQAALRYLRQEPCGRCCLLLADDVKRDFADVDQTDLDHADTIVLGDLGDELDYPLLNRVFNRLMLGARLIAIHRNRFWQTEQGLRMDIGGFIAALEYCSGREAVVMGKPSPDFFLVALRDLGLPAGDVALVGDDIEADVGGAQGVGIFGILVRTGKFRQSIVEASSVQPDVIIDSVTDLPVLLGLA